MTHAPGSYRRLYGRERRSIPLRRLASLSAWKNAKLAAFRVASCWQLPELCQSQLRSVQATFRHCTRHQAFWSASQVPAFQERTVFSGYWHFWLNAPIPCLGQFQVLIDGMVTLKLGQHRLQNRAVAPSFAILVLCLRADCREFDVVGLCKTANSSELSSLPVSTITSLGDPARANHMSISNWMMAAGDRSGAIRKSRS